jgi:hypothetical protein
MIPSVSWIGVRTRTDALSSPREHGRISSHILIQSRATNSLVAVLSHQLLSLNFSSLFRVAASVKAVRVFLFLITFIGITLIQMFQPFFASLVLLPGTLCGILNP